MGQGVVLLSHSSRIPDSILIARVALRVFNVLLIMSTLVSFRFFGFFSPLLNMLIGSRLAAVNCPEFVNLRMKSGVYFIPTSHPALPEQAPDPPRPSQNGHYWLIKVDMYNINLHLNNNIIEWTFRLLIR